MTRVFELRRVEVSDDDPRCFRDGDCLDAAELRDEDGGWIGKTGALLGPADACGLCAVCNRNARWAVASLPGDWDEVGELLFPTLEIRLRDPDIPTAPRVKLHSPMPLKAGPLDWQLLVDHELDWIAEAVVQAAQVGRIRAGDQRTRMREACALIADHWDYLLAVGPTVQPARSLGFEPLEGHNPDEAWFAEGDVWITRTGPQMASRLLDLHLRAEKMVGRGPQKVEPIPCPGCRRRTLIREHTGNRVVCRNRRCEVFMSDDAFDRLRSSSPADFLALADRYAAEAAEGAA